MNAALKRLGREEKLKKGDGYCYFYGGEASGWYSSSVGTYRVSDQSTREFLRDFENLKNDFHNTDDGTDGNFKFDLSMLEGDVEGEGRVKATLKIYGASDRLREQRDYEGPTLEEAVMSAVADGYLTKGHNFLVHWGKKGQFVGRPTDRYSSLEERREAVRRQIERSGEGGGEGNTTLAQAKAKLATKGIVLSKRDGEYRVNFRGGSEDSAYYTNDIEDAVGTGENMAARRASHAFEGSHVNRGGKRREVKNLGWLLRHAGEVESFTVIHKPGGEAYMIAHLHGGGTYESDWASYDVMKRWLRRPSFRDTPVNEGSESGGFSGRRCVGRKCDERPSRRFGARRGEHNVSSEEWRDFVAGYIEAALWSSTDNSNEQGGEPLDKNYGPDDLADETKKKMRADCIRFMEKVDAAGLLDALNAGPNKNLREHNAEEYAGHDFWLTRNGHGVGFWDGDWPDDVGEKLTEISKEFGEYGLYVGDDGQIYGSGGKNFSGVDDDDDEDEDDEEIDGYHDCDCCGETIVDQRLCDGCKKAGCEKNSEGVYDDCQIPNCPECDTPATLNNNGEWSSNCDDDCPNHGKTWKA